MGPGPDILLIIIPIIILGIAYDHDRRRKLKGHPSMKYRYKSLFHFFFWDFFK